MIGISWDPLILPELEANKRPTWPPPQMGLLHVEDKCQALFYSATWSVIVKVGDWIVASSLESQRPHSPEFTRLWVRSVIRANYVRLRELGVDAEGEYQQLGGDPEELKA